MRAGLSTIQQTLTPEAAAVLSQSISEAGRRNHGHTTPLHVAAALLASPSSYLRQACIRSHPDSSHPLQCRALELCFSVALERLPALCNTAPFMQNRNPYLNPLLEKGGNINTENSGSREVNRLLEIMSRTKRRNPILVGDSEPEAVVREFLKKIESKEILAQNGALNNARVISIMEKDCVVPSRIGKLCDVIGNLIGIGGVILDLGNLRWLADHQHQQQGITEHGRTVVAEMARLLARFNGENNKVWLIGTANCETYLRCQVYFSSMENELDLQAVPVASRSRFPGMVTRLETQRASGSPVQPLNPAMSFQQIQLPALTKHAFEKMDPSQSIFLCCQCSENYEKELAKIEWSEKSSSETTLPSLPQWLQNAKFNTTDTRTCDKSNMTQGLILNHKIEELHRKWRDACRHLHPNFHQTGGPNSQPSYSQSPSPVRTDLVLGPDEKLTLDIDTYKRLLKRLMEQAWWQPEAATAVALTVARRQGDTWLLFVGPDVAAKRKMASVVAEHIRGNLVTLRHVADLRGKTVVDRVVEAIRRNPSDSVIVVEGAEQWCPLACESLKRAAEIGRIADSHGCEVALGNVVFVLSGDWSTGDDERRFPSVSTRWQLGLRVSSSKRARRGTLSLDLNLALPAADMSSDDVTIEHEEEDEVLKRFVVSVPQELTGWMDGLVVFKPGDLV
ncbi:ATP binding protein [Striga asiatica]|uniref:ATP binding protein n=1 Tax=Striga asiatica TaxID=4170 RepID=A0A5A7QBV0_STRAF|nr:ATP binding protein [Striga asiatica]